MFNLFNLFRGKMCVFYGKIIFRAFLLVLLVIFTPVLLVFTRFFRIFVSDFHYIDVTLLVVMSQFVIYVALEAYLAQWVTYHFGEPVVFPYQSNENAVIRTFLQKLPPGATPEVNDGSMTAIAIPESKAKPASYYNYIGPRGKKAIREMIKDLFLRSLWSDLSPLKQSNVKLNSQIAAWCELHGIDVDRVETVRQCYYRIRDAYAEKGVRLKK